MRKVDPAAMALLTSGSTDDVFTGTAVPRRDADLLEKPFSRESLPREVRRTLEEESDPPDLP
jgi:hypothetical protein